MYKYIVCQEKSKISKSSDELFTLGCAIYTCKFLEMVLKNDVSFRQLKQKLNITDFLLVLSL